MRVFLAGLLLLALALPVLPATAQEPLRVPDSEPFASVPRSVVDKAEPDECWTPDGTDYVPMPEDGVCPDGYQPKVNQGYVWAQTTDGDHVWWGTAPNYHCLVFGSVAQALPGVGFELPSTDSFACEYGDSPFYDDFAGNPYGITEGEGDWRPPKIYQLTIAGGQVVDRTPDYDALYDGGNGIEYPVGMRSAGTIGDVVYLAGPTIGGDSGLGLGSTIVMYAFDVVTGAFLGAEEFAQYANIRSWTVADGRLFTGFTTQGGDGEIVQFSGDPNDPFQFSQVGQIPGGGVAELTEHEGRLYATTWPTSIPPSQLAGLYMSPPLADLDPDDVAFVPSPWQLVWSIAQYEQDMAIAAVTAGSALRSFDGHLYWSTLQVPFTPLFAHLTARSQLPLGPPDVNEILLAAVKSHRATTVWRGDGFEALAFPTLCSEGNECELLYGEQKLPAYDYLPDPDLDGWSPVDTGWNPLYGPSGLGNPFNTYTWSMEVWDNQLWLGTFDWSYLLVDVLTTLAEDPGLVVPLEVEGQTVQGADLYDLVHAYLEGLAQYNEDFVLGLLHQHFGADLFRFPSAGEEAVPESKAGVGNFLNYGVRSMSAAEDTLFLGMANPMNLETDLADDRPEGGWELLALGEWPIAAPPPPPGPTVDWDVELEPATAELTVGASHTLTATLLRNGSPASGLDLTFLVEGAHDATDVATTDGDGEAELTYTGETAGEDTITAFRDTNGNGQFDTFEDGATATATWTDVEVLPATIARLAGAGREETAIAVSQEDFGDGEAGAVVLARSDEFADALTGTPLAVALDAPMLLSNPAALSPAVEAEIQRVLPIGGTVVLLGGEQALSTAIADRLAELGYSVERVFGPTRYETALEIAHELGDPDTVMITTGLDFPDALGAGVAAAVSDAAVLLTPGEVSHPTVDGYLADNGVETYAIGGPAATAYPSATPLVGADRTATAVLVAEEFFTDPTVVGVARHDVFADALSGGPHIARAGGPMVLTDPVVLSPPTAGYLRENSITLTDVFLYGGEAALTPTVAGAVLAALA